MPTLEIWSRVKGGSEYEVSNLGRVRNGVGRIKQPTRIRSGGLVVNLYSGGATNVRAVRSLVAEAFIGPRPKGQMAVHLDGNELNCQADNIAYAPLGLRRPKHDSPRTGKLTSEQAREIRIRAL